MKPNFRGKGEHNEISKRFDRHAMARHRDAHTFEALLKIGSYSGLV
jgi:hypothetical protein